jgi:hypothetical protein
MTTQRCVHGIDRRFCAICNRTTKTRPVRAIADTTLEEILRFLNDQQVRATYGAVAEILNVPPRSVGAQLGERRPEASWVVNAENALPTGYRQDEMHPSLVSRSEVISSGTALAMRMAAWKSGSRRD